MKTENRLNIEKNKELMISPLRAIAFFTSIAGIIALFFEMYFFKQFSIQIYFGRIIASIVGFLVLMLSYGKFGKRHPYFLVHFLLLIIILSFASIIIFIPKTLFVNAQLMALVIFLASLFLSWEIKHQIVLSIYYNIVFATSILLNEKSIYFLPNMYALVIFVISISLLGIVVSAVNYKLKKHVEITENKLQISEERFKNLFDSAAFGIFQFDTNGELHNFNTKFMKILKYESEKELLEKRLPDDFFDNKNEFNNLLELLKKKDEINDYRVLMKGNSDTKTWVKLNLKKVVSEDGNIRFFNSSVQDISEQVLAEFEHQKMIDALQMAKAESDNNMKKILKYSQSRAKFLAKINHEIRTPVNTISGYLALIEEGIYENENDLRKLAKEAKLASDSLLEIINHNLDIYNIENRKLLLDKNEFFFKEEIEKAISLIKPLTRKDVQLIYSIDERIPEKLIGDETRFRQILINLLQNSSKFTEHGKIRLAAKLENLRSDSVVISFRVTDTGKGIPADKLTGIFNKDFQIDENDIKNKGTGLGLQICKEIIEMMKGKIEIQSIEGKGTVVDFLIQFAIPEKIDKKEVRENEEKTNRIDTEDEILLKAQKILELRKSFEQKKALQSNSELKEEEIRSEKVIVGEENFVKNDVVQNRKTEEIIAKQSKNEQFLQEEERKEIGEISNSESTDEKSEEINSPNQSKNEFVVKEGQKAILLVEDNLANQKMETTVLSELGYSVLPVSNGFEAIEEFKHRKFDLILMDIVMPEMDGVETAKRIREISDWGSKIPIIAVTAHASVKDRERCIQNGMNDYISKPIKIQFLKMIIDEWLFRWK